MSKELRESRKHLWVYLVLWAAVFLPLIGIESARAYCGRTPHPPSSPLSPEELAVKETILDIYRHMSFKGLAFDTSRLDQFFVDDPRFPLRQELRHEVELALGQVPEGAGYRTYMRSWYKNWNRRGTPALEELYRRRAITARPRLCLSSPATFRWLEIRLERVEGQPGVASIEAQLGYFPLFRSPMKNEGIPEDWMQRFHFFQFEIQGEKATCLYNDWGTLRRAYLVRKAGKWYIADSVLLAVYP